MIEVHANSITLKGAEKRPIVLFGAWPHEVKIFTKPEELAEWERRARAILRRRRTSSCSWMPPPGPAFQSRRL